MKRVILWICSIDTWQMHNALFKEQQNWECFVWLDPREEYGKLASTNSLGKALLSHPYLLFLENPWGNLSLAIRSYLASLSRFKYLSLTIQQREVSVIIWGYLCLWGCSPRTVLLNGWIITILPTLYKLNWTQSVLVTEQPCRATQVTNPKPLNTHAASWTLKRICPAT